MNKLIILILFFFCSHLGAQDSLAVAEPKKGKIVFTGAETEFLNQYHLQEDEVCINAVPDENEIGAKLSFLIEHPEKISKISKNARNFIEKEHDYRVIAKKYLGCWE